MHGYQFGVQNFIEISNLRGYSDYSPLQTDFGILCKNQSFQKNKEIKRKYQLIKLSELVFKTPLVYQQFNGFVRKNV